jgi:hypothetical protein
VKVPSLFALRRLNKQLKSNSFPAYCGMLLSILRDYEHVNCLKPLSGFIRSRRFDLLLESCDYLSEQKYPDATIHLVVNQVAALVRKYPWDTSLVKTDPERKALESFLKSEHRCKRLNQRFRLYSSFRSPHEYYLAKARSFISYVLGDDPSLGSILDKCDYGPGASLGVHGDATSFGRKVSAQRLTVTPGALTISFHAWMSNHQLRDRFFESRTYPSGMEISCVDFENASQRFRSSVEIVENNKVSFVPKTAKTHRAIAVEPSLNSFVQKGIDLELRSKLRRINIDLSDQSENCRMAREGSLDDSDEGFCTIDLSSASDSISIGLVKNLLPRDWFNLLDQTRSPTYKLSDGSSSRYEKFCSMGNGFCFPLQTLIFASLAHAVDAGVPGSDFRVYGDDIIVRRKSFQRLVSLLNTCGFRTNTRKTFSIGPFRESCGSDWYAGADVRPYTLDHALDSLENLFKFLNLSRRSNRTALVTSSAYQYVLSLIPSEFRLFRPFKGNPDSAIDPLDYQDRFLGYVRYRKAAYVHEWLELKRTPVRDAFEAPNWCVYAAALRGHESSLLFTFRRRTKMSMRFIAHSGASCTWLPDPSS